MEEIKKYICEKCKFETNYKSNYNKHIRSELHKTGIKKTRSDKKNKVC